jgi:hypothetical protein
MRIMMKGRWNCRQQRGHSICKEPPQIANRCIKEGPSIRVRSHFPDRGADNYGLTSGHPMQVPDAVERCRGRAESGQRNKNRTGRGEATLSSTSLYHGPCSGARLRQ